MARIYNFIYSELVKGDDDIVGHIAYALYKVDKIHFIEKFKAQSKGKDPDESDLKPFHVTSSSPGSINRYKQQALSILQEFTNNTLEETIKDIEQETINNNKNQLTEIIKPLKPVSIGRAYFHGTAQSVLGAFIFMLLLSGLLFLVSLSSKQYTFTIGGNGGASVKSTTTLPIDSTEVKE